MVLGNVFSALSPQHKKPPIECDNNLSDLNIILSLLRSGALEQAEKEFFRLGLDKDTSTEDSVALGGRILKAKALDQSGAERRRLAHAAAQAYGAAFSKFGGSYSGINTAAMQLLAGDTAQAQDTARQVQDGLWAHSPRPGLDAYYRMATLAEAWLILGEKGRAERALEDAIPLDPHNYIAHASTLKQFAMVLATLSQSDAWLDRFRPPKSLHFAGHMFGLVSGRAPLDRTAIYALEKSVDDILSAQSFSAGFGALAAGSDIIIAERLIKYGIDLHVVQPCPDSLFQKLSLSPFGADWVPRFRASIEQAASVRMVSTDNTVCDDMTTAFASETAMGLSMLYAEELATTSEQLVIWDRKSPVNAAGTARDAHAWQNTGHKQHIVPFPHARSRSSTTPSDTNAPRSLKAMLFADVKGFGRLTEKQVPLFVRNVLVPLAEACQLESDDMPRHINTWGDGLFLVFNTVAAAARMALRLQDTFHALDLRATGMPETLALRVGGHYGPVHMLDDPFLQQPGLFGREVTAAARIEPVTAPGSIFVSEQFACALALSGARAFRCERMFEKLPIKNGDPLALFSLRRIRTPN